MSAPVNRLANLHRFEEQPGPLHVSRQDIAKALRCVRAKLIEGWARTTAYALNADGRPACADGCGAVAWSIAGAFVACGARHAFSFHASVDASRYLSSFVPDGLTAKWNAAPGRTKDEVLALLDRAIEEALR